MSRRTKIGLLIALGIILAAVAAGILYLRSNSFRRYVLARVIQQIEETTGGRVEARAFNWSLRPFEIELRGLVVHGLEGPDQPPLISADSILIQFRILSLFRRQIDWRLLRVTHPVMHLLSDKKGDTNFPEPKVKPSGKNPLEQLWELAIKRVELRNGEFYLKDQRVAADFDADDVRADLNYRAAGADYPGNLSARVLVHRRPGTAPVLASVPAEVQVALVFSRNALEATSFTIKSAHSEITGSGRMSPLLAPVVDIDYSGRVDARELLPLFDYYDARAGTVQVKATFHYVIPEHAYVTSGDMRLERLAVRGDGYNIPRIDGAAKVKITNTTYVDVDVPAFRLFMLGGEVSGHAHGDDLKNVPRAAVAAEVRGFSVSNVLDTASTRDLPLNKLAWVGSIAGDLNLRFALGPGRHEYREVRVSTDLKISPPTVTPPGHIPVSGEIALDYAPASRAVALRNLLVQTPGSRIAASGNVDLARNGTRTAITLDASISNFAEWQPLIAALRPGQPLPLELAGPASFRGAVSGSLAAPSVSGRLEAANFTYEGRHWDRFAGDVAYSPDLLRVANAQLVRGRAAAQFNLSAGLRAGNFSETSPIILDARLQDAQFSDLQSLAGTDYPIEGEVNGFIHVTGTRANPQGSGALQVTRGVLLGEPFDLLRADLLLANQEVQANNITLRRGKAAITGQAAYRERDKHFRFQLTGNNVPLTEIQRLRSEHLQVTGLATFRASGEGTLDQPSINADVRLSDLVVNGEQVGTATAVIETRNRQLTARVQTQLLRGKLVAEVTARMEGEFPGQARLEFSDIDLDPLLGSAVRSRLATHSVASGLATLSGPLKHPDELTGAATVTDFRLALPQADFHNVGPLRASFQKGVVHIEQAHLAGNETDLGVTGTVKLTGPPAARVLALRLDGSVNLRLLNALNPNVESWGQLVLAANVTGTMARPQMTGRAEFRGGNLALRDFSTGLSNIRGAVLFDTRRIQVQDVTAQVGGGPITLSGFINYGGGELPFFRLNAVANQIRIRYPQGTSSTLDAKLQLTGTTESSQLAGEVSVTRVRFDPQFDLARELGMSRAPLGAPAANPILAGMRLGVRVVSSPEMRFEFAQARNVQLEADLRLRGTAARPALLGRISLLAGEIAFAGTHYEVNRGDLLFTNPFKMEPSLNLSLSTRIQQYDIAIDLSGTLDRLNVAYRSDPPLPSNDIQVMLITGQTQQSMSTAPPPQALPQLGANTILSQALNMAVTSRIERIFGVSQLKIDPQFGGPETSPGARVLLQQQVTQDVRFTYITNLSQTQQTVVQVEWQINDRWSVLAVRDENGLFGLDLRWRKRFH